METSNKAVLKLSAFGFIMLTLMLVGLITFYSYQNKKNHYQAQAQNLYQSLVDTALINKVILEGFASIADEIDEQPFYETLSRYTEQVKKDYSHIYMLELQQHISANNLTDFEHNFINAGLHYFKVKSFSYEAKPQLAAS